MRQQMNSFTILEEQNEVVDEFLYNIRENRMRQQMNSFTILEEQNEVVDEFLYNIRGIE